MRILFVTDNYPPESNAPALRTSEHVNEWVKNKDVSVTILTCFPNFPQGKIYPGYKNKLIGIENHGKIKIIRVWSYIVRNKGKYRRILDHLSFCITSTIVGIFLKVDVIVATSPQFFTSFTAFFISKIKKVPWIFEVRDLWPKSIESLGVIKNRFILRSLEKIELFFYRQSSKIVVVTNSFKSNLVKRGILRSKIKVIKNGVDLTLFNERNNSAGNLLTDLKDKFVIGFIGTHGISHGLEFIIKCIPFIKIKGIHFLFIGDGANRGSLIKLARDLKVKNITFLPQVPRSEIPRYYNLINVALIPLKNLSIFKSVIPSKIFEACAMKKPILLGVQGEAKSLINNYFAGLTYMPENKEDFINKMQKLKDKKIYKKCQEGAILLAKKHDRKFLARRMLDIIKKVAQ